ncbi:hypothetical protein [Nocardioides sp.]|uniref:hypothetical protein n=1 Tax=Nocardioides sp. TaxID=35761 RepID=UPI002B7CC452|nr:hypothetical protein [Nocardioides sp.]HSX68445.1 hypothetical protein [Nocardioides sp.]
MATITGDLKVCDCCALMLANGDDSGCRDYYGHTHDAGALLPMTSVIAGDPEEWQGSHPWLCDGCDEWQAWGSNRWPVVVFG